MMTITRKQAATKLFVRKEEEEKRGIYNGRRWEKVQRRRRLSRMRKGRNVFQSDFPPQAQKTCLQQERTLKRLFSSQRLMKGQKKRET
jgi:hypothetical protein